MIGPFCTSHSIYLNIGFWQGKFVWKYCVFNLENFELKYGSPVLKKDFIFQILVLYIFKLVLYFSSIIFSNQMKYYLVINRGNLLQIQYGFYRLALQIQFQPWWSVIERACTKNSRKLMSGTWLFGALWSKIVIKALLLYEILHESFFFFSQEGLK